MCETASSLSLRNLADIEALIAQNPMRMRLLQLVCDLHLPDAWIGAGFVRNLVWDALHGFATSTPLTDVDVVYFNSLQIEPAADLKLEARLLNQDPHVKWQVRNQARMHIKNGDAPYTSCADAIARWPETATAVAARVDSKGEIELLAPLGVDDLLYLRVCPTSHFAATPEKRSVFRARVEEKNWSRTWPKLTFEL